MRFSQHYFTEDNIGDVPTQNIPLGNFKEDEFKIFKMEILDEWADITLAAKERHGQKFFGRSMAAYYIDNVKAAAADGRTPPDWWYEFRKLEYHKSENSKNGKPSKPEPTRAEFGQWLAGEAREQFERVLTELMTQHSRGDKLDGHAAETARREATSRMWEQFRRDRGGARKQK